MVWIGLITTLCLLAGAQAQFNFGDIANLAGNVAETIGGSAVAVNNPEDFTITNEDPKYEQKRNRGGCCAFAAFICRPACSGKPCAARCTINCGCRCHTCSSITCAEAAPDTCARPTTTTTTTTTDTVTGVIYQAISVKKKPKKTSIKYTSLTAKPTTTNLNFDNAQFGNVKFQ